MRNRFLQKRHLAGLEQMKKANGYAVKELLAQHPDATDAYIAPGIANYIIGSQSAGSRFVLRFDGVHGDKKLGMEQVAKTARKRPLSPAVRQNHPCSSPARR